MLCIVRIINHFTDNTYKVFSKILYLRPLPHAEEIVGNCQYGYQHGKNTNINTNLGEKAGRNGIKTHHLFVDFVR